MSEIDKTMITVTLRGGIEIWGVEFVQWLEKQLDTLPGLERVGKSITDDYIHIHMSTKTVFIKCGVLYESMDDPGVTDDH